MIPGRATGNPYLRIAAPPRSLIGGMEATVMKQKPSSRRGRNGTKSILRLPDLEHAKAAVLNCGADCRPFLHLRLQQIVQPGRPGSFSPAHMAARPLDRGETRECCWLWFPDGFHHLLPVAIHDGDNNRFLVRIHSDIFDVVSHLSCLLGGKLIRVDAWLSLKANAILSRFAYALP